MTGLLPGTFDPVHLGHVSLARAAMARGGFDEVWLLVNAEPAHKVGVTPYEHRLAMAKLAVADEAGIRVVDWRGGHNWAGFREFMTGYPGRQFVFVLGMDAIAGLDRWNDVESVVNNTTFAVARRAGSDGELALLRERLGPEFGAVLDVRVFDFEEGSGASSGRVRAALYRGERPELLDARVEEYIRIRSLYEEAS